MYIVTHLEDVFNRAHLQQQLAQFVINKTKLNDTNGHERNIRK